MNYIIRIVCRSDKNLEWATIQDFILEGIYFDSAPSFSNNTSRNCLTVTYEAGMQPILIEIQRKNTSVVDEELEELKTLVESIEGLNIRERLEHHLSETCQIVWVEFNQDQITDEIWALLDSLEAWIAKELNGIVFAPNDGFFDEHLRVIYRFNHEPKSPTMN